MNRLRDRSRSARSGLLNLPLFGVMMAPTLVTYAEPRYREDRSTGTGTLAADVPR